MDDGATVTEPVPVVVRVPPRVIVAPAEELVPREDETAIEINVWVELAVEFDHRTPVGKTIGIPKMPEPVEFTPTKPDGVANNEVVVEEMFRELNGRGVVKVRGTEFVKETVEAFEAIGTSTGACVGSILLKGKDDSP